MPTIREVLIPETEYQEYRRLKEANAKPLGTITVHVEGGMVQDVTGVPPGYELRVEDYDHPDDTQPSWDAQKECFVTVYGTGAA